MFAVIGPLFIFATNCILTGHSQDYSLRLTNPYGNSSKEGRLEISYLGVWGTVCDDGFTDNNSRVACASLGYGYNGAVIGNRYGAGSGQIWLDDVNCTGTEIGIEQCVHLPWGQHNCSHSEDVSISCDCTSRDFNERTGHISSPNHPRSYANNLDCVNYITYETGQKVIITFLAFHTQETDWVTVTCESGNTSLTTAYSGSRIPAVLTSTSCYYVIVYFHTDNSTTYTGFNLSYNIIQECPNSNFSGNTGQISSPNYPNAYGNYLDCSSYITVSSGQKITITFLAFSTQPTYDYVTITCETGMTYSSASYSGSQISAILTITLCTYVKVYFHTDGSTVDTGFNLAYNITSDSQGPPVPVPEAVVASTSQNCIVAHSFDGLTGQISSPKYSNESNNYLDCSSYISVSPGKKITITFLAFNTKRSYDYVTISCESGNNYTSPNFSGSQIPAVLTISSCYSVKVYFHTDGSTTYSGFNLTYSLTSDCGGFGNFSGPTGKISSPNYPNAYNNYLDCSNYITVPSGQTILISFLSFNTEPSLDWLTISCETGTALITHRYSGPEIPAVLTISSCSPIDVHFHTDSSITNTGFSFTYNITNTGFSFTDNITSVPDNDMDRPNSLGMILGVSLGAIALIIITIFVILLSINFRRQKSVGGVGHKIKDELHQPYETSITNSEDADKHAYDDLERSDHYEIEITNSDDAEINVYDDLEGNDHHETDIANSDHTDTNVEGSLYYPGPPRPQSKYSEIYDEIDN